uniref:Uncharacterized protein n=1 Tax=Physcomitrium patens TaxID=3218 RepID=A0A2K1KXG1_PHYPA|nr:hypothetical protein PHYPA_005444 [Physcomitrium patens]
MDLPDPGLKREERQRLQSMPASNLLFNAQPAKMAATRYKHMLRTNMGVANPFPRATAMAAIPESSWVYLTMPTRTSAALSALTAKTRSLC